MKKVAKRILLSVALLLTLIIGGLLAAIILARAEPEFYKKISLSAEKLEAAAQSATNKLADIQNHVARLAAANRAAAHAAASTNSANSANRLNAMVAEASKPIDIAFTADELNAFFDKWSTFHDWKAAYSAYVTDPGIVLEGQRIILAAKSIDLGLVVSLHFEPTIDAQGQLHLPLVRVLGGRLPLPMAVISKWQDKVLARIATSFPEWQKDAAFDNDGGANAALIRASSSLLFVHALRDEPSEPTVFLPVVGTGASVPVQITSVAINDGRLVMTVNPLTHDERVEMLNRIKRSTLSNPPRGVAQR